MGVIIHWCIDASYPDSPWYMYRIMTWCTRFCLIVKCSSAPHPFSGCPFPENDSLDCSQCHSLVFLAWENTFKILTHWGQEKWTPFRRRHFEVHFFNENVKILVKISLRSVPMGPINNIPALVQIMACCNCNLQSLLMWSCASSPAASYMVSVMGISPMVISNSLWLWLDNCSDWGIHTLCKLFCCNSAC